MLRVVKNPLFKSVWERELEFLEWVSKVQPPWPWCAFPGLTSSEVSALFSCCLVTPQVLRFSLGAGVH